MTGPAARGRGRLVLVEGWSPALLVLAAAACGAGPGLPHASRPDGGDTAVREIALAGPHGLQGFSRRHDRGFGLERIKLVSEPTAAGAPAWYLRVDYPRGSTSPSDLGAPGGGAQFLGIGPGPPADHLFLRYRVRFAPGFPFVKGGKLPGLYGGRRISGGRIPDGTDGFSTRFMWRAGGAGEVYAYLPSSTTWGTSLGRGSFQFEPGRWHCLEQEVALNTPGRSDGIIRVWLDGRPVFATSDLLFRTAPALRIEGIFFSTFFGGHDASWAPPADTHADFADFALGGRRVGCAR